MLPISPAVLLTVGAVLHSTNFPPRPKRASQLRIKWIRLGPDDLPRLLSEAQAGDRKAGPFSVQTYQFAERTLMLSREQIVERLRQLRGFNGKEKL